MTQVPTELSKIQDLVWNESVVGMGLVSPDGTIKHVNPAFSNLVEFTEVELQGRHFREITHPDDTGADVENVARLVAGQIPGYIMRKRYLTKTGRTVWIKLKVSALREGDSVTLLYAQISPIEQDSPPRFPGDLELQKARKRQGWQRLIKWGAGALLGAGLATTGAIMDNASLLSVGLTVLGGAGLGAVAEEKKA